jgi:hypothetical protein
MPWLTPEVRKWIYGVSVATIPVLIVFGWLDDNRAPAILGLLNAVLIGGMAFANTHPNPAPGDEIEDAAE